MAAATQSRRANVTDRAHRYRANATPPPGPKQCAFCGSKRNVEVGHLDGHEENGKPSNLVWTCRSCNVTMGNELRKAGRGRLTNQYNPSKGATTVGEWMRAVGAIDRRSGKKYSGRFYGLASDMPVADAVRIIRATSKSKRQEFAAQLGRHNPSAESIKGFTDFHGEEPSEFVEITQRVHNHKHLSGAGELEFLKIAGIDGYSHTVKRFGGSLLAFNEARNQIFIRGGDQCINLRDFGILKPHELETLGKVTAIGYQTTKTHLGSEGGTAIYDHKFRTINEDGKHVTVRIARYPDLIYRVLDKQMEFSGGSYEILPEGINR